MTERATETNGGSSPSNAFPQTIARTSAGRGTPNPGQHLPPKLPSRGALRDHLGKTTAAARRDGLTTCIMCLRFHGLEQARQGAGEATTDRLLELIGNRLRSNVRTSDAVAQLGPDEFAVVASRLRTPFGAYALARRLSQALAGSVAVDGADVSLGISIGIAFAEAEDGDPECWLQQARLALRKAAAEGPGAYRCSNPEVDAQIQVRLQLETELRQALAEGQLVLHYQPLVELSSRRVVGFEALTRWEHPTRGRLMPSDFLPVAEESGQMVDLGAWMLRRACRDALGWPPDVKVATNFSLVEFRQKDMVAIVTDTLDATGLDPRRLIIEVSENTLAKVQEGLPVLHRLRALGISIAMDDFGAGGSSLGHLQSFPFDRIKIDHSLIAKIESDSTAAAIVRAAISFGRSLNMTVTAEGVETQGQLDLLREEACHEVQGFYFSQPMPNGEIDRLIALIELHADRKGSLG